MSIFSTLSFNGEISIVIISKTFLMFWNPRNQKTSFHMQNVACLVIDWAQKQQDGFNALLLLRLSSLAPLHNLGLGTA